MSATCPFCGSAEVELISLWGGQIITSQMQCRSCSAYFEAVRDSTEDGVTIEPDFEAECDDSKRHANGKTRHG